MYECRQPTGPIRPRLFWVLAQTLTTPAIPLRHRLMNSSKPGQCSQATRAHRPLLPFQKCFQKTSPSLPRITLPPAHQFMQIYLPLWLTNDCLSVLNKQPVTAPTLCHCLSKAFTTHPPKAGIESTTDSPDGKTSYMNERTSTVCRHTYKALNASRGCRTINDLGRH